MHRSDECIAGIDNAIQYVQDSTLKRIQAPTRLTVPMRTNMSVLFLLSGLRLANDHRLIRFKTGLGAFGNKPFFHQL